MTTICTKRRGITIGCRVIKNIRRWTALLLLILLFRSAAAQDDLAKLFTDSTADRQPVAATFKSDRIVNAQSNETVHRHDLTVNISHLFDDLAGSHGGVKTFFGLDNSTDIKIGIDYGFTDRLMAGISRSKGAAEVRNGNVYFNSLTQLWEGKLKYRLLRQTEDNHIPFALTLFANAMLSTRSALEDPSSDIHFQDFSDRWGFMGQIILARKFSRNISFAILPTYVRRNSVAFMDENDLFALGAGGRVKLTSRTAILFDYFFPFRSKKSKDYFKQQGVDFYPALSVGWEVETGGHVFHLSFSNATALLENQAIPYTTRSWLKGEFRLGFNIERTFTLGSKRTEDVQ